jgi:hypothetical protein
MTISSQLIRLLSEGAALLMEDRAYLLDMPGTALSEFAGVLNEFAHQ